MENPRTINRFCAALLIVLTAVASGASIYFRDVYIVLGWLATVAVFFLLCVAFALLNIAIFAPLFRLLARLDAKLFGGRQREK